MGTAGEELTHFSLLAVGEWYSLLCGSLVKGTWISWLLLNYAAVTTHKSLLFTTKKFTSHIRAICGLHSKTQDESVKTALMVSPSGSECCCCSSFVGQSRSRGQAGPQWARDALLQGWAGREGSGERRAAGVFTVIRFAAVCFWM